MVFLAMSENITVGEGVIRLLEAAGVETIFGVISIHNMPFLDAILRRNKQRFVPARGEAGATNMADANARVTGGVGVAITSTGTGAGNACGALVEAQTAGTPLLHLTGQIDTQYLDKGSAFIHEARDQLGMLRSVSKRAFRVENAESALDMVTTAIEIARTPPAGPVSVEIPIDIQKLMIAHEEPNFQKLQTPTPSAELLDELARRLGKAQRPILWLGGGARHATRAVARLADMGFGVVTSTQGRGILAENHPMVLGSFNSVPSSEEFYQTCDAMLVVGSHLRGNETLGYRLKLPKPLYHIDVDEDAECRNYLCDLFICGDAELALDGLVDRLTDNLFVDPNFANDLSTVRQAGEINLRKTLGPYETVLDGLIQAAGDNFIWVRDITLSNSIWGNRLMMLKSPRDGVHPTGGGIGQGVPLAIGAALAAPDRKTLCLTGDGGLQLCMGELATAVQEATNLLIIVMNDQGYGVIRNIQDAQYEGRRGYTDIFTPNFSNMCASFGMPYLALNEVSQSHDIFTAAIGTIGPVMVEVDMASIGDFAIPFAGPPVRSK